MSVAGSDPFKSTKRAGPQLSRTDDNDCSESFSQHLSGNWNLGRIWLD